MLAKSSALDVATATAAFPNGLLQKNSPRAKAVAWETNSADRPRNMYDRPSIRKN